MSNVPQTAIEQEASNTVRDVMRRNYKMIQKVLPKHLDAEKMAWLAFNSVRKTPALADCSPVSFINSVMLAAQMGVEIRANSAYLIPFGKECQLVIDYRGLIDIAARAGITIHPPVLHREGDFFDLEYTECGPKLRYKPSRHEPGEVEGGFVTALDRNGRHVMHHRWVGELEALRAKCQNGRFHQFNHFGKQLPGLPTLEEVRAKAASIGGNKRDPYCMPWVVEWDRMAEKSLIRQISNRVSQSPEMTTALAIENAADAGTVVAADGLEEIGFDPADSKRSLVEGGGDTREEQKAAQVAVREQKMSKLRTAHAIPPPDRASGTWNDYEDCVADFQRERERLGDRTFGRILGAHGLDMEMLNIKNKDTRECYEELKGSES